MQVHGLDLSGGCRGDKVVSTRIHCPHFAIKVVFPDGGRHAEIPVTDGAIPGAGNDHVLTS